MLTKVLVYAHCVGVFSSRRIQRRLLEALIATRKQQHGERPGPCPRGPLPTTATRVDRMSRKLHTKAGAVICENLDLGRPDRVGLLFPHRHHPQDAVARLGLSHARITEGS